MPLSGTAEDEKDRIPPLKGVQGDVQLVITQHTPHSPTGCCPSTGISEELPMPRGGSPKASKSNRCPPGRDPS